METQISTKSLKQPKSIEIVASNDDLLTEILFRLPVEPLIRCELVSKRWQSLITNPNFRRRRNLDPVPAAGLFLPSQLTFHKNLLFDYVPFASRTSTAITPFRRLEGPRGVKIIHSCSGLLLCCSCWTTSDSAAKYSVYNPTTNKSSNLPELVGVTTRIRGMCLAYDPTKSPHHYKVVCVRDRRSVPDRFQIEIYSSRTRAWRTRGQPLATKLDFENGVYWNNAIHWISTKHGGGYAVYFNVHHHVLEKMPNPPIDVGYGGTFNYFGESCDHLHYIHLSRRQTRFNVYEMKRDYSEWFVKYNVDLSPVISGQTLFFFYVCVVRDEEEDGSFLVVHVPGKVIRYNLALKTFENLHEFETAPEDAKFASLPRPIGFQYIESLCCV